MNTKRFGQIMFNLGILFALAQGVREPLRSALLDQISRVLEDLNQMIEEGDDADQH